MQLFFYFVAALLPFLALSSEEAVVTLTKSNFDQFIKDNKNTLVEFYAPWCGHCKSLAPEYEKAAKKLLGKISLGKVDATVERELAEKFEVRGYPTLKFFRSGKAEDYSGGRTEQTIVDWIESNIGPAVLKLTESELETLKNEKAIVFVLRGKLDGSVYELFENFADANRDLGKFVAIEESKDTLEVHRKNEGKFTYSGPLEEAPMTKWIQDESFPLYGPINGDNYARYQGRSADLAWVVASPQDSDKLAASVREVAQKFRGQSLFVHLDTNQFASHAENSLGVSEYPSVVVQKKNGRYVFPESTITTESLTSFIEKVGQGLIKRSLKSETVPEKNDAPVKVIVGNNFQEMVMVKDKSVFLEIYAPWCGHCKKLEPTWNEIAEQLKGNSEIMIAKMDGTANETPVEGFDWSGFPSIFFVKAGSTTPLKYNGGRSKDDLLNYLKSQGINTTPRTADEL